MNAESNFIMPTRDLVRTFQVNHISTQAIDGLWLDTDVVLDDVVPDIVHMMQTIPTLTRVVLEKCFGITDAQRRSLQENRQKKDSGMTVEVVL